ncbi:DUF3800 domain-containing protein [Paraferrimonas haliotis]|uniref:DUF3800 domain-containing protein n=1 Tax=Paraferrimonas haliotis TaxID=2013866 RepID=A0AA37TXR0_9GAMM|nr:DUF3800 domain-containing protein [Paraferrimonas haliotis]GLS84310.1 hypothetical protein GCM10007894_22870 [Paraferrimonas haliotis]
MFFHIDESGNTGNNLFDESQPRLSYGLISSVTNVDALCIVEHNAIRDIIDDDLIHANILGIGGLVKIAPLLIKIQKKMKFDFDYYFIEKLDYALVIFFDAVFDAGLNDAVKWDTYWTPLRYVLIHKLSILFDEDLLRESWRLSTVKRIENCEDAIVSLLSEVKSRAENAPLDARSKELIIDALDFGIRKPLSLDFGHPDQKIISPNAVGFQFVVAAIARRTRKKLRKSVSSIIVDRQNQFNKAQIGTHYNLSRIAEGIKNSSEKDKAMYFNNPLYTDFSPEEVSHKGLTDKELTISKSADSIGLQIVDVYLWIANKLISGVNLPSELMELWQLFQHRSLIDGISMRGMAERFKNFEKNLPKLNDLTDEQRIVAKESVHQHRKKVKALV